ncbi:hypothetical protein [Steroidobacter denitrificans]|nr:hypothetical protein [Steroidobacter denitrificans]
MYFLVGYTQQSTGSYDLDLMDLFALAAIATTVFGFPGAYLRLPQAHT